MPQVPIIMPQLGESIAEATIVSINVKPGEKVTADQEIIEVQTNKAVMGVTTPCAGEIAKIDAQVKETYPIGAVLGYIEASEKDAARFAKQAPPPEVQREMTEEIAGRNEETAKAEKTKSNGARAKVPTDGLPVPAAAKGAGFLSPRVRARMAELQLTNADLAGIAGTGSGNRVTIKDLENYLHQMESQTTSDASAIRAGVADAMRRSGSKLRHFRGGMGHADSPARSDHDSRSRCRQKNTTLGRIEIGFRSDNGGANHAQLRSSQSRWRRCRAIIEACDRAAGKSAGALILGNAGSLPALFGGLPKSCCTRYCRRQAADDCRLAACAPQNIVRHAPQNLHGGRSRSHLKWYLTICTRTPNSAPVATLKRFKSRRGRR